MNSINLIQNCITDLKIIHHIFVMVDSFFEIVKKFKNIKLNKIV